LPVINKDGVRERKGECGKKETKQNLKIIELTECQINMAIFNFNNIHTLKRLNNSLFRLIGNETQGKK